MYILKNALISITRNKGRNILIGIIIFVIALSATITLAINNTAKDLITSYESAYDKEVTISFNRENMMKDIDLSDDDNREKAREKFDNISSYTVEDIKKFAESKYVKSYYYTNEISLNGSTIEKVTSEKQNNFPGGKFRESSDFTLIGYSTLDAMSEFMEGTYEMTQIADNAWSVAFNGNYVFINEELASYNNLSLNDKIKLSDEDGNEYEFEIIGIYKENESGMDMFSNSANKIITNSDCISQIASSNENIKSKITPTFIIDDYKNKDKLEKEFYKKGLDANYVLETNEEQATSGLSSIKNVKSFSLTFLIITLIIGGVVLFIINMINIRERKYEIGVLRTIGISKIKLTMQFVLELLIVAFVSLMIGCASGSVLSKGVSNSLLSNEIKNTTESAQDMRNNFGGPDFKGAPSMNFEKKGVPSVQAYKSINAVVDIYVMLELLVVCLTLVFISSLSAMISIQRFSPLDILKERS